MSIEANYIDKINEIIQHADSLTDWERDYIFGKEDSRPILERPELSLKQKGIVDRIYKERVQGASREETAVIDFGNTRVTAIPTDGSKSYRVVVDQLQVGPVINSGEATAVVGWLSSALTENHITLAVAGAPEVPAAPAASEQDDFPAE